jgi:hypothetical protein
MLDECREKQIKLIELNEHKQQIGSSQLIEKSKCVFFAMTVSAL